MNYLRQVNEFNERLLFSNLSSGQISLWHALMHLNNKCGWIEWFTVANSTLQIFTGLTQQGILNARNQLIEKGLLKVKTNGNNATAYHLIKLYTAENKSFHVTSLSTADEVEEEQEELKQEELKQEELKQEELETVVEVVEENNMNTCTLACNDTCIDSCTPTCTLNKLNKTKLNKTNNNISHSSETNELAERFKILWEIYPRKKGRPIAFKAYCKAVKDGVTDEQIKRGIENYLTEIKIQNTATQYIKQGGTWFNQQAWTDEYVTDTKQVQQKKITRYEKMPSWYVSQQQAEQKIIQSDKSVQQVDNKTALDEIHKRLEQLKSGSG